MELSKSGLRPDVSIPAQTGAHGFELGHRLLGTDTFEVVQLTFEFRDFTTYHVLLNPSSPVVRRVLDLMLSRGEYFVLVVNANGAVNAFRSELGDDSLSGLMAGWPRRQRSTTTAAQYRTVVESFSREPQPPGQVLAWVCGNDLGLLDLASDRLELRPP